MKHKCREHTMPCKTLTWQKRNNLWDRYVQTSTRRSTIRITTSIAKLDGCTTESHGETRRQRLHLQLRSGKLHNGKRVGAHGSPHHLRNGVISVSWKEFQKIDGGVDRTPTHNPHLCSTVCSQARNAHHALGSSHHGLQSMCA